MNEYDIEAICPAGWDGKNTSQEEIQPGESGESKKRPRREKTCGVYRWTHTATGRKYVGSSKDMERRKREQILAARWDSARFFARHLHILGVDSFSYEVLEICPEETRLQREKFWIEYFDCVKTGFNVRPDPTAFKDCYQISDEGRQKLSHCGRTRVVTEETRARLRFAHGGKNHHMYGKRHSEITKFAISLAHIGKKMSPETKAKLSAAQKGRPRTPSQSEAIQLSNHTRILSQETIKKMSDARKAFWARLKQKQQQPLCV